MSPCPHVLGRVLAQEQGTGEALGVMGVGPICSQKSLTSQPTLHAHVSILTLTKATWPQRKQGLFGRKGLILYFLAFVRAGK